MKNTKWIYAVMLAALICCVVFMGCPTAEEIAEDVIRPMDDDMDSEVVDTGGDDGKATGGDESEDDGGDTPPNPGGVPPPPPPGAIPPPPVGN